MLSTTTHDLKGPLGTILLSSELLQDMVEPSKTKDLIVRIASSAQGAINLIEEFLSVRKIQEGHLILRPSSHSLKELIESATNDFTAVAKARNIKIISDFNSDSILHVDKLGFHRALGNLLSNACKFTPKNGSITIKSVHRDGEVYLSVCDTGPGMEAAEVRQLFEKFSRLDKHASVAGTGLGLFVVKSIISAHGGRIEVRSQPGQGSEFTIILPDMPPVNERGELISLDF
jgi:signal transduction histidine kinase